jgi:hypothetical protein
MSGSGEKREFERSGGSETAGPTRGGAGNGGDDREGRGIGTGIVTKTRAKTKKPSLYKVLLLNDDYTPMEFVVHVWSGFSQAARRGGPDHAPCPPPRCGHLRRLHSRWRNHRPGDRIGAPPSTSVTMYDGRR